MLHDRLRHKAVDAAITPMGQRQPQQRRGLEWVLRRHLQRYFQRLPQPCRMPVSPQPFGWNACRAGVGIALQQRTQQHRAIFHVIAEALQSLGHLLQRQPGIGGNKIQITGNVLHAGSHFGNELIVRCRIRAGLSSPRVAAAGPRSADAARCRPWTRHEFHQWF